MVRNEGIRRGDLVEFSKPGETPYRGYFGVATEHERADGSVTVRLADGTEMRPEASRIYAYGWLHGAGVIPPGLEEVWEKIQNDIEIEF